MLRHVQMLSHYNRWANERIYAACAELTDDDYRADRGAFFGSAHRTLNHILVADRIWLHRITGQGSAPTALNTILFEDLDSLTQAREAEDRRIIAFAEALSEAALQQVITYTPVSVPVPVTEPLSPVLAHVFNHQTHHRGQVHAILTSLGKPSVVLDMIAFLRSDGRQWM